MPERIADGRSNNTFSQNNTFSHKSKHLLNQNRSCDNDVASTRFWFRTCFYLKILILDLSAPEDPEIQILIVDLPVPYRFLLPLWLYPVCARVFSSVCVWRSGKHRYPPSPVTFSVGLQATILHTAPEDISKLHGNTPMENVSNLYMSQTFAHTHVDTSFVSSLHTDR